MIRKRERMENKEENKGLGWKEEKQEMMELLEKKVEVKEIGKVEEEKRQRRVKGVRKNGGR